MKMIELSCRSTEELIHDLSKAGASERGVRIMCLRDFRPLKIFRVPVTEANVLKQEMLSLGGDACVSRGTVNHSVSYTNVILLGNPRIYDKLVAKLGSQEFSFLREAGRLISGFFKTNTGFFRCCDKTFSMDRKYIMGILNVTPDSFYTKSRSMGIDEILMQAGLMVEQGADFLDIGAESTRPGAQKISAEQEIERLSQVIPALKKNFDIPLSIDTYKAKTACFCLEQGVEIVNDISGLDFDPDMGATISRFNAGVILMHIKGTPENMQNDPTYHDVISEVHDELYRKKQNAFEAGISCENIILDIGIGFGKRVSDNYALIRRLSEFRNLGCPLLVGLSRKSLIGKILENKAEERLCGTIVLNTLALFEGADIIRVHDVKEAKETIVLFEEYSKGYFC